MSNINKILNLSKKGYKKNSPHVDRPFNVIPSNEITMKEDDGTPLKKGPILGIGIGKILEYKKMMPGKDYKFSDDVEYVIEKPLNEYEHGGAYTMMQDGGPKDTIIYPPGDSEYMNQRPLNYDILEMLNQKARREYENYIRDLKNPNSINKTSPQFQQKFYIKEALGLQSAKYGGLAGDTKAGQNATVVPVRTDIGGRSLQNGGPIKKFQTTGEKKPTLYVDPNDPTGRARYQAYQDSLNLYKAYVMQDKLMGPGNKKTNDTYKWNTKELEEGRKKEYIPLLKGYYAQDFQSEEDQFKDGFSLAARKEDKQLLDYYKKLGFKPDQIMYHSSPDVVSDKIKAIGSYFDGDAVSPIYKKPTEPVEYKLNPEIVAKQQQLIDAGFNIGKADGIWGPKSQAAWEQMQTKSETPSLPNKKQTSIKTIAANSIPNKDVDTTLTKQVPKTVWKQLPNGTWYKDTKAGQNATVESTGTDIGGRKFQLGGQYTPKERIGVRQNPDGSVSSHLMMSEVLPNGNWVSFPSLFQNEDGSWVDMSEKTSWYPIYLEALKRGEVYNFGKNKEAALEFGRGSWKKEYQTGGSIPKFQTGDEKPVVKSWDKNNNGIPDRVENEKRREARAREPWEYELQKIMNEPIPRTKQPYNPNQFYDNPIDNPNNWATGMAMGYGTKEDLVNLGAGIVAGGALNRFLAPAISKIPGSSQLLSKTAQVSNKLSSGLSKGLSTPAVVGGRTVPWLTAGNLLDAYSIAMVPKIAGKTYDAFSEGDYYGGAAGLLETGFYGLGAMNPLLRTQLADDLTSLYSGSKQALNKITTQTPLKNAYKYIPGTLKEAPFVPMYRTQKPGQTQEVLELLDLQKRANEVGISNLSTAEKIKLSQFQTRPNIGQGFDTDLSKASYYGNPNIRKTRGYDETPEVLRVVVPREQAELLNVKNFPEYVKQSTATRTEHILPMDMVQQAEKFSFDDLVRLREEEALLNPKPNWLKGYPRVKTPSSPFNTRAQNNLLVEQARRSGEAPLPSYMEPYISRRYTPAAKEQEVFESFLSPEKQAELRKLRTQTFNPKNQYKQGGYIKNKSVIARLLK